MRDQNLEESSATSRHCVTVKLISKCLSKAKFLFKPKNKSRKIRFSGALKVVRLVSIIFYINSGSVKGSLSLFIIIICYYLTIF